MTDKKYSPLPGTEPAPPTTQAPVPGCPLCDAWSQWVGARVQERGSFGSLPIDPAELHDLLMVGCAIGTTLRAADLDRLCLHHGVNVRLIAQALAVRVAEKQAGKS